MREFVKEVLCDLQERAAKDIKKLMEAKPDFTPTEWKSAGDAVDVIKDVECSIKDAITTMAMESEYPEDTGMSERGYYRNGGDSYAGNRRRNPMNGQYMSEGRNSYNGNSYNGNSYGGSSYSGDMNGAVMNLRNLMNNAKTDSERMMYQRWLNEAEHDTYGR